MFNDNDPNKQLKEAIALQEKAIEVSDRQIVAMIAARNAEDSVFTCMIATDKAEGKEDLAAARTDLAFARAEVALCEIELAQMGQGFKSDNLTALKEQLIEAERAVMGVTSRLNKMFS
jgi:hypothetical protein